MKYHHRRTARPRRAARRGHACVGRVLAHDPRRQGHAGGGQRHGAPDPHRVGAAWARPRWSTPTSCRARPLTLRLENVPEQQALDILLRSSSGFMAAERAEFNPAVSVYDRILLMPPSTAVASAPPDRPAPAGPRPGADAASGGAPVPAPPPQATRPTLAPTTPSRPLPHRREAAGDELRLREPAGVPEASPGDAAAATTAAGAPAHPSLFPGSVTPYSQPSQQPAPVDAVAEPADGPGRLGPTG